MVVLLDTDNSRERMKFITFRRVIYVDGRWSHSHLLYIEVQYKQLHVEPCGHAIQGYQDR